MRDTQEDLERAFNLIKRDKNEEALDIVRPIIDSEPDNVHAWWLLAYASTEPFEVREALVTVLRLDPNYANAPKAREMLSKLNQEYPPDASELAVFPELQATLPNTLGVEADLFADSGFSLGSSFDEIETLEPGELIADDFFASVDFAEVEEDIFATREPLSAPQEDLFAAEEPGPTPKASKVSRKDSKREQKAQRISLDFEPEQFDDETMAAMEERAVRRRSRGRRTLLALVSVAVILLGAVLVLAIATSSGTESPAEPGDLRLVENISEQLAVAQTNAQNDLRTANLGPESRAVVANSAMGDTMFIEICGNPSPALPDMIGQAMDLAARQAPSLQDSAKAVGVNVHICQAGQTDTLYRAVVSTQNASRYLKGEISWEAFQSLWKTA